MNNNNLNLYSSIFTNEETAIEYLTTMGCLSVNHMCSECNTACYLIKDSARIGGAYFRCKNSMCRKKYNIINNNFLKDPKIRLNEYLKCFFMFSSNFDTIQTEMHLEISIKTYYKIKDKILEKLNTNDFNKIGGPNSVVVIDETAICDGIIITNPSSALDFTPGIQWILGGVVEGRPNEVFLALVPNRRASTILGVFNQFVESGSIIRTDGYPSYPRAVSDFGSEHQVVSHIEGFSNNQGQTTNAVENMWSALKMDYRARCGLRRERISLFVKEFFWRKRIIGSRSSHSITAGFYYIIELIREN